MFLNRFWSWMSARRVASCHRRLHVEPLERRHLLAVLLNEVNVDPPSSPDKPYEYVELIGAPNESLDNLYLVFFDGDLVETPGTADFVKPLTGLSLGTNGLAVIKSATGGHTIGAGTTIITDSRFDMGGGGGGGGGGAGGHGAIENGAIAVYLISSSTAIVQGTDYDADNNGTLELLPAGATILDSVGWKDNVDDIAYGPVQLTQAVNTVGAAARFAGNTTANSSAAWFNAALVGLTNSSLVFNAAQASVNFPLTGASLTPGAVNEPANTAPQLDLNGAGAGIDGAAVFYLDTQSTLISGAATVVDTENPVLLSARAQLAAFPNGANESLSVNVAGTSISSSYNASTGVLALSGSDTLAHYQQVLRTLTYANTATSVITTPRSITVTVNDNLADSLSATATLTFSNIANVAPVNNLPAAPLSPTNTPLIFSTATSNAIAISDADAGSATVSVTLTATLGTIQIGTTNIAVTGNGSASVSAVGTIADLNAALDGLTFTPVTDLIGAGATIQIVTNDRGNSGTGGAKSDSDTIAISLQPPMGSPFAVNGNSITATGTAGNDSMTLLLAGGGLADIYVNGAHQRFSPGATQSLQIDGGAGVGDQLVVVGSDGVDSATLSTSQVTWSSSNLQMTIVNNEANYLFGSANDTALFLDTPALDAFYGVGSSSIFIVGGFWNQTIGFGATVANSDLGGDDFAIIAPPNGSALSARYTQTVVTGAGINVTVNRYSQMYAFGGVGNDVAQLFDGTGNDAFYGLPNVALFYDGGSRLIEAVNYDQVTATASSGYDLALFYDSSGDDTLLSQHDVSTMSGPGYINHAAGFDGVYAIAYGGGNDFVDIIDSAGNDFLYASGDDLGFARGQGAFLAGYGFETVNASSIRGGFDTVQQLAILYALNLNGSWVTV